MKLAIITNKPYGKCETFIKAQVDLLPFEKVQYWGTNVPFNISVSRKTVIDRLFLKIGLKQKESGFKILEKYFKKEKIEIVLAEYGMMGAKVLPVCKFLNLPLVVHFHGHDAVRKSILEEYSVGYQEMFNYPKTTVVSVSFEMTRRLINGGCPIEKISYNPYGPSNDFLKIVPDFSKLQFISVGRFVEKKAPHLTILSFKKVCEQFPEAVLILAGEGILLDSCKDLVKALQLEKNIIFPGSITPSEYRNYLKESIAYVQHSIEAHDGDMEGTPVSILEASGAGLPVVATIHAGIPDVIIHNETGFLVQEHNIDSMADSMLEIIKNPSKAKEMGTNGKARVSQFFSMTLHIDNLAAIINKASLFNEK